MALGKLIYAPFQYGPYRTLIGMCAICAGYTVIVLGLIWSGEKLPSRDGSIHVRKIAAGHLCFLAAILGVIQLSLSIQPHVPDWLDEPFGITRLGRPASSAFQLIQIAALVAVLFCEWVWLSKAVKDKGEESG